MTKIELTIIQRKSIRKPPPKMTRALHVSIEMAKACRRHRSFQYSVPPYNYNVDKVMSLGWFLPSHRQASYCRRYSGDSANPPPPIDWRKKQLEKLENRFKETLDIQNDEDLQPMWKEMEGRVTRRKPRTTIDTGGKTGRSNIRKTDEEVWEQEGFYTGNSKDQDDERNVGR